MLKLFQITTVVENLARKRRNFKRFGTTIVRSTTPYDKKERMFMKKVKISVHSGIVKPHEVKPTHEDSFGIVTAMDISSK